MMEPPSPKTRVQRGAERAVYDRDAIVAILDAGLVAHVGIVTDAGAPVVIPMAYAIDGDHLLVHGSVASRLMRTRSPVCVTVTILDGLVVARSLFESSMNYRSVVVFGAPEVLVGDEKREALLRLSDKLLPGRVDHARGPSAKELAATTVWRISLSEASAKVRTGPADEDPGDVDLPFWGGVIPVRLVAGDPEPDALRSPPPPTPEHILEIVTRLRAT